MCLQDDLEKLSVHRTVPSYLKHLLRTWEGVVFVCAPKTKSPANIKKYSFNDTTASELDLTGCPLALDLSKDDTACTDLIESVNWYTPDEAKEYHPISLNLARKYINFHFRKYKAKVFKDKVYCFCDAKDPDHTVILGSFQTNAVFARTVAYNRGCVSSEESLAGIDYMQKKHLSNTNMLSPEVECKVTGLYSRYGYDLTNVHVSENTEILGSVLIEASWQSCEYEIPPYKSTLELKMQLIAGHLQSPLESFWKDILILQHFVDKQKRNSIKTLRDISTSINYLNFNQLVESIGVILSNTYFKRIFPIKDKQKATLPSLICNMAEIKDESFLDKLWMLLVCCESSMELKDCFLIIFEEIAQKSTSRLHLPEDDTTNIANIISGLYNGTIAVPNINENQAVELLIELGIEKLRRDYFFIVNYLDLISRDSFHKKWNEGLSVSEAKNELQNKKSTVRSTLEHLRATRTTISSQSSIINMQECLLKLEKLKQIHLSLEFLMLLVQHCALDKQKSFYSLASAVFEKCIGARSPIQPLASLKAHPLCKLSIPVSYEDMDLNDISTLMWHIELKSKENNMEVSTVFLHSDRPIFPPTVSGPDTPEDTLNNDKLFHITELITYTQHNN